MNRYHYFLLAAVVLVVFGAITAYILGKSPITSTNDAINDVEQTQDEQPDDADSAVTREHFAKVNSTFAFSAELNNDWKIDYVAAADSLAVYPSKQSSDLNEAVVFIRHFTASSFLTLNSVNILSEEQDSISNRPAVRYLIEKKPEAANFAHQPSWRNSKHNVVDIRLVPEGISTFFVFAQNPNLDEKVFRAFLSSIVFDTDPASMAQPMKDAEDRITKKSFGTFVTPANSPVQPERFSGYHTGQDYEAFENEIGSDVEVRAICGGKLLRKTSSSGYGGYAVQQCQIDLQIFTVVYGHIRLSSVSAKVGDYLLPGQKLAVLGRHESSETDGERMHLHLSIVKGTQIDIRGYVSSQSELSKWLDPTTYL